MKFAGPILALNAGSSSLKFGLFHAAEGGTAILRGEVEGMSEAPRLVAHGADGALLIDYRWPLDAVRSSTEMLEAVLHLVESHLGPQGLCGVGHRIVHGGPDHLAPARVTPALLASLDGLTGLDPLHMPHCLNPVRVISASRPGLPQVACFDTAFHRRQPAVAQAFALPREFGERGVIRYGFHGLSYEFIAEALRARDTRAATGRTVVLHLGNGASMCAMSAGRSMASTMGFTAVDGLPMGTRCGNLDPGVLLYCMNELRMDAGAIEKLIYQQSGLLGVSGISSDMRTLEASADPHAREAVDLFCYRIGRELGSLVAALGGLDAIVFTAGIGEHSASLRTRVCRDAAWLGIDIDEAANQAAALRISTADSRVAVLVVPTNEELMIARHTRDVLAPASAAKGIA